MRQLTGMLAGLVVALGVWACLPFSTSYITSPPIAGVYRAETGEALSGVLLAISIAAGDSLCASPARLTATDSAGAFSFPATEGHDAVIVLGPSQDRFFGYSFCARVSSTMRFVFEEHTEVSPTASFSRTPVSLTCVESRTPNTPAVACTKQS